MLDTVFVQIFIHFGDDVPIELNTFDGLVIHLLMSSQVIACGVFLLFPFSFFLAETMVNNYMHIIICKHQCRSIVYVAIQSASLVETSDKDASHCIMW